MLMRQPPQSAARGVYHHLGPPAKEILSARDSVHRHACGECAARIEEQGFDFSPASCGSGALRSPQGLIVLGRDPGLFEQGTDLRHLLLVRGIAHPEVAKARLPAMPESLSPFTWHQVFKYAVTELALPGPEERRRRIEQSLTRFEQMLAKRK